MVPCSLPVLRPTHVTPVKMTRLFCWIAGVEHSPHIIPQRNIIVIATRSFPPKQSCTTKRRLENLLRDRALNLTARNLHSLRYMIPALNPTPLAPRLCPHQNPRTVVNARAVAQANKHLQLISTTSKWYSMRGLIRETSS